MGYLTAEYAEFKKGIPEGDTSWEFIEQSAEKITVVSAAQLSEIAGGNPDLLALSLDKAGGEFIGSFEPHYDEAVGKFKSAELEEVRTITQNKPREINQANLDALVQELHLSDLDESALNLMSTLSFQFLLDFVVEQCEGKKAESPRYTQEFILKTINTITEDNESDYHKKLISRLSPSLVSDREYTPNESKAATTGIVLANYTWQLAKLYLFGAETDSGIASKQLQKDDFRSFKDMLQFNYDKYIDQGVDVARIMAALKLFQDVAQYM